MSGVTSSTAALDVTHEGKRERERLDREALAWVLSDPRGRRFMGLLIYDRDLCGLQEVTTQGGLERMALWEGRRHVAIDVLRRIEDVAPEALGRIDEEWAERRRVKRKTKQTAEAVRESEDG